MTVTRAPTGQDLVCLVCGQPAQDIDHVVNRGMGGSKARDVSENKVSLCRGCHDAKTMGVLETSVITNPDGGLSYLWRRHVDGAPWQVVPVEVSQRYKCLVGRLSDGAEEGNAPPQGAVDSPSTPASAPSLSKEESEGEGSSRAERPTGPVAPPGDSGSSPDPVPTLTHEQRVAKALEIKNAEWNRQWIAGDTGNQWIAELGEEADQYLSDFGYVHESLSNILRVCAAIPPPYRNGALRYSHHVVVYQLPREEQVTWLKECELEGWSVAEFRRQVKGTNPKTKRWPISELLEGLEHWTPTDRPRPKGAVRAYLTWLGER